MALIKKPKYHISVRINRVGTKFTKYSEYCKLYHVLSINFITEGKVYVHWRLLGANYMQLMNHFITFLFSYQVLRTFFCEEKQKLQSIWNIFCNWQKGYLYKSVCLPQHIFAIRISSIVHSLKYSSLGCTPLWLNP